MLSDMYTIHPISCTFYPITLLSSFRVGPSGLQRQRLHVPDYDLRQIMHMLQETQPNHEADCLGTAASAMLESAEPLRPRGYRLTNLGRVGKVADFFI